MLIMKLQTLFRHGLRCFTSSAPCYVGRPVAAAQNAARFKVGFHLIVISVCDDDGDDDESTAA